MSMRRRILSALLFGAVAFIGLIFADFFCLDPWSPKYCYGQSHTAYNMLSSPNHMLSEPDSFERELGPYLNMYLPPQGVVDGVVIAQPRVDLALLDERQRQKFFYSERLLFCQMYCLVWLKMRGTRLLLYPVIASRAGGFIMFSLGSLSRKPIHGIEFKSFFTRVTGMPLNPSANSSSALASVSNQVLSVAMTEKDDGTIKCELNSAQISIPTRMAD